MTPVDATVVSILKAETGENYPKRWSGFSATLGSVMEKQLNVQLPHTGPVDQVLLNITKTLPSVANQLGIQVGRCCFLVVMLVVMRAGPCCW